MCNLACRVEAKTEPVVRERLLHNQPAFPPIGAERTIHAADQVIVFQQTVNDDRKTTRLPVCALMAGPRHSGLSSYG